MKKQSGFTLIELMVVMAIIAILATAGLSAYTGYIKKARDTVRLGMSQKIETAVLSFMASNNGEAPDWVEIIAELDALNLSWVTPPTPNTSLAVIDTVNDVITKMLWVSHTYAFSDPIGGISACLNASKQKTIPCNFNYILFNDGTYAISHGIESENNMENNFYVAAGITGVFRGNTSFIGSTPNPGYVPTTVPTYTASPDNPKQLDETSGGGGGGGAPVWSSPQGGMNWYNAVSACEELLDDGGGWRLPTFTELSEAISDDWADETGDRFVDSTDYWSSTEGDWTYVWVASWYSDFVYSYEADKAFYSFSVLCHR